MLVFHAMGFSQPKVSIYWKRVQTVPSLYIYHYIQLIAFIYIIMCAYKCLYQAQKEVGGVPVDERAESRE